MRRLVWLIVCFALPAFAQTKHPFTFEDMMKLKRVEEPVPSPDWKWVAFAAVDVDLAANTKTPHIWIAPTAGGESREIIAGQDADRPRWAPDGKRFLFLSSKESGQQVWIADFDGNTGAVTAMHRLTSIPTEADGPIWSPDGENIVFVSSVYPECAGSPDEAVACNAKKLDEAAKSKVKAQIFARLLYRHWNAYKEGKRNHIFAVSPDGGTPRDLTPGDYDSPVFSLGGQDNYAISPDGRELCYTSNHDPVEATSTNNDLWIVPITGGAAKNITADNPASDSTPLYSPDGEYIAYRAQKRPGYEADRFRLMLYERATGRISDLTEGFDRWVDSFGWAGAYQIFFNAENEGNSPLYGILRKVCLDGCYPIKFFEGYNGDVAPRETKTNLENGTRTPDIAFVGRMSIEKPTEIFATEHGVCVIGLEKTAAALLGTSKESLPQCVMAKARQLTHLNDAVLSRVEMSPLEAFWFEGAEKAKVQGFLVRPPNFDPKKKYPLKLLIHGGPQGAWGDDWSYRWNAELFAANGYVVLQINPRGSTGYGQKFIDDVNGDWGGRAYEDIMKGLDYAEQHYGFIDKDRECALGASYGGYMINWILGHTNRFKCLVSHDGMFNADSAWGSTEEQWFNDWEFKGTPWTDPEMYAKWSPHRYAKNFKTPTLVVHGQRDYRLDVSEGFQLFSTLQRMHVPSKMLYFPDEGHWVLKPQNSQLWYKTVNEWVDQWIGDNAKK